MAYTESQPVKEAPGFARAGEAVRRAVVSTLGPVVGDSTRLGRALDGVAEAASMGLMAGPPVARMRFRPPRLRVPERALRAPSSDGSVAVAVPGATVRLPDAPREAAVSVARSEFAHPPGDYAVADAEGRVTVPFATRDLAAFYDGQERIALPGGRKVRLSELPAVASEIDASRGTAAEKAWNVRRFNDAVNPTWMYRMYERDVALANGELARRNPVAFDERLVPDYDVLSREAAAAALANPLGTKFAVGDVVFSPVHVSGAYRTRFDAQPSLYDAYNAGHLPFQSVAYGAPPRRAGGAVVTPVARLADHVEAVDAPASAGITASGHARADGRVRTAHVRGEVPVYGFEPTDPGGVRAMYALDDGTEVASGFGNFFFGVGARQAAEGGDVDGRHDSFRNFLATDEVPESIFGIPVVQDESRYTEADIAFFRENPKAAGFYEMGAGEEMAEEAPRQAVKAKPAYKYIDPATNKTVTAIRDALFRGEGAPEIGFATEVDAGGVKKLRSGSGYVGDYFTTNFVQDIARSPVPAAGLTQAQNDLSNNAAAALYYQVMYRRFGDALARAMPIGAMAVYADVMHHGAQENNKSPQWDADNRLVWAARNGDQAAAEALKKRGYRGADFSEVAARQLLDYYRDSGTSRIYDRMVRRFDLLRGKLPRDARPWDYFGDDYKGPRAEVEAGLKASWKKLHGREEK